MVSQPAQPNITSLGPLTGLTVNGLLSSTNGSGIANLTAAAITGNVANANVALVVSQPAQPNITSLGTLTGLTVNGLLSSTNGSGIANLTAAAITGNVANANVALVVSQPAQPNITSLGTLTGLTVNGLLSSTNGSGIANLTAAAITGNVANANVALVVSQPAQPNVTSLGTLTGLTVNGSVSATNLIGTHYGALAGSNLLSASNIYSANSVIAMGNIGAGGTTAPAYPLDVTGAIRATGDIIAFSDSRVKTALEKIENALEKVSKITGYTFNRIDGETRRQAGVIAQDVLEVLPEVVYEDVNGRYNVAYGNLVALLIEAIKEEKMRRELLEERIKILEQK